ncbi:hypothetical protein BDF22DRAFT_655278 [Syncephalis plumigaleata]|nr:hypothetical protein BDF22DRAFT_655278 [Syncephalis plumigaleata]
MSNYYQSVQKHEKEHEEETRQSIVNAATSISSNSPDAEAAEEHWIDYIYVKKTAIRRLETPYGTTWEPWQGEDIFRGRQVRTTPEEGEANHAQKDFWAEYYRKEALEAENQHLDLFGAMAFAQDNKGIKMKLYTDYDQSYKDIIK